MSGRPLPTTNVGIDYEVMEGTLFDHEHEY